MPAPQQDIPGTDFTLCITKPADQLLCGRYAFDMAQGALNDVQIEVTDSQILGKNAKLETLWTMNINGNEFFRYVTILMEKINKKWYIVDFSVSSRSAVS